ncbi:antibiotic biosynthesis monooxygenase [Seongchinamella unica]|uniref:Antibiotic biosynthesis monooxygenase n=1 Tax=Seongchinamella unica TaxID=2547392 RepID=A0A4R5LW34_9GAMM|nr:antibiotic biosynthesis monooxygenase [Seongchinamella unica]TDG15468.1 antibiotic biosynthesis monooxygenase [Seongchinamella unica]
MYAVIFRADIRQLNPEYVQLAEQLRTLAMERYGCREFFSCTEGNQEVAISYWDSEQQISRWKQDPLHQRAQQLGREQWYASYRVQVVELKREYAGTGSG